MVEIFERRILSGIDDVEQRLSGSMSLSSSDLELVNDGSTAQKTGLRFTGIDIPRGATVTRAYIQFQADETGSTPTALLISGLDSDDAAPFAKTANNLSSRQTTDAVASWNPEPWTARQAGAAQQTPDLSALIQEILDRSGWQAGNDMGFVISGSGTRTAEAYEGGAAIAPKLHVEWEAPSGGGNRAPTIDLDASSDGAGFSTGFAENSAGAPIAAASAVIQDPDGDPIQSLTVTVAQAKPGDRLQLDAGALPSGITVDASSTAAKLTLTGAADSADYAAALLHVLFANDGDTPDPATRSVSVTASDGRAASSAAIAAVAIDRAPDAVDDALSAVRDSETVTGPVLANDDQGDGPATISAFDAASLKGGAVRNNGDGTFSYTPAAGFTGADSFVYTIADRDGDESTASVAVTVASSASRIFETRILSGLDDVEQRASGSLSPGSSDLELVSDGSNLQKVGLRFTGIDIPQGADISRAYIQFQADESGSSPASLVIRGLDSDDLAPFAATANNLSSRPTTDAAASWNPDAWTARQAGAAQQTPDLSALVQEVLDRPGWQAGNDLGFVISGSGTRTAEPYEGGAAIAPKLHIEWTAGEPDIQAPEVALNAPADGANLSGTVQLSATASDNVGVKSIEFRLDSEPVGALDTTAPFGTDLNTLQYPNGAVALSAVAVDFAGNRTVSEPVSVTIDNGESPPPPPPPPSGTIRVPEDYATIQEAVDAAGDGDTILVGPGTYAGGVVIAGKSITLASHYAVTGDPGLIDQTIITPGTPAVLVAESAPNTVIQGFHFQGGTYAVQIFGSGGQVLDNFFDGQRNDAISFESVGGVARGNHIANGGDDGIDVDHARSDLLIADNLIESVRDDGIEIRNQAYTGPLVTHTIRDNTIVGSGEDGVQLIDYLGNANRAFVLERNLISSSTDAGLGIMDNGETLEDFRAASMPERVLVFNNTFDGNSHGISGGDNLIAVNNIISNSSVLGVKNVDGGSVLAHILFFGNAVDEVGSNLDPATTIEGNPLFTSAFGLTSGSPAIDAGTISFTHEGELLLELAQSEFSGASADLGWREFLG